ncbi:MAG: hypothetical protein BroJett018_54310 [Chloroflexota bacterium]|nr:MAG: hypothetical protein BroJett018_54310 [Chloroflexota bacterium]
MPPFINGLTLSRAFYLEAVAPILNTHYPNLPHAAALIGSGSEVLGYDTEMSTDHHWGPRVLLFLHPADHATYAAAIAETLRHHLPYTFRGYPTNFGDPSQEVGNEGVQLLSEITSGPVNHRVEMTTLPDFVRNLLGITWGDPITPADWLAFPQQKLLEITAGDVFHDAIGLNDLRRQLAYYPNDVWRYLLIGSWNRIGQDEHLAPRAGYAGDELGSAVIAGRLVRSIMQWCFLMERRYAPYPKWLGTAFMRLTCGPSLSPILRRVQMGETWQLREGALVEAYEIITTMHNSLGITDPIIPAVVQFYGRPFRVSRATEIAHAIRQTIDDPAVQAIVQKTGIGSIDQFSDNTDLREDVRLHGTLAQLYRES